MTFIGDLIATLESRREYPRIAAGQGIIDAEPAVASQEITFPNHARRAGRPHQWDHRRYHDETLDAMRAIVEKQGVEREKIKADIALLERDLASIEVSISGLQSGIAEIETAKALQDASENEEDKTW